MNGASDHIPPLAVTVGEPSGVGPDILLSIHASHGRELPPFLVVADPDFLRSRARRLNIALDLRVLASPEDLSDLHRGLSNPRSLPVLPLGNRHTDTPARLETSNGAGTIEAIDRSVELALEGRVSGVVTGPIDKKALYDVGFAHPGHTEYLADLCANALGGTFTPVMLLTGPDLSCVPVTIHIPISEVPAQLTSALIEDTCRIVDRDYRQRLGLENPRLAVAGLNPHAGERGAIGQEDERVVRPAVERLRAEGLDVRGPLPADTMFHPEARARYDVAVCMYHDQALVPAKTLAFDQTVNVTLGLPIIRTSPDHGTAADLAGSGKARIDSFLAAIRLAWQMAEAEHRAGTLPLQAQQA